MSLIYLGQLKAESFTGYTIRSFLRHIAEAKSPVFTFATQNYIGAFYITGIQLA